MSKYIIRENFKGPNVNKSFISQRAQNPLPLVIHLPIPSRSDPILSEYPRTLVFSMDFHNLSRKDLQTLCKKNKIPANLTNVTMADALQALQIVRSSFIPQI